jgi:hypothetical protein
MAETRAPSESALRAMRASSSLRALPSSAPTRGDATRALKMIEAFAARIVWAQDEPQRLGAREYRTACVSSCRSATEEQPMIGNSLKSRNSVSLAVRKEYPVHVQKR